MTEAKYPYLYPGWAPAMGGDDYPALHAAHMRSHLRDRMTVLANWKRQPGALWGQGLRDGLRMAMQITVLIKEFGHPADHAATDLPYLHMMLDSARAYRARALEEAPIYRDSDEDLWRSAHDLTQVERWIAAAKAEMTAHADKREAA